MKKFILTLAAILMAFTVSYAGTPSAESLEQSAKRIEQLQKLLEKEPKACGNADVDALQQKTKSAAVLAVSNSQLIIKLSTEGVNAADLATLAASVAKEGVDVKEAGELVAPATKALKSINPMKAGGVKKCLDFSSNCLKLLTEESMAQAQMLAELSK